MARMNQTSGVYRWTGLRGMNRINNPSELPESIGVQMLNVLAEEGTLGRRRSNFSVLSLNADGPIRYIGVYQTAAGVESLFQCATDGGASEIDQYTPSTGAQQAITLSDTVAAFSSSYPHSVTFNGKWFVAYNSDVNRLHCYPGTGSALRRVGVVASGAPTAADNAVAGSALARYYKVQFFILDGSNNVTAQSELSAALSYTPAGAFQVVVTKPTTPDSATHWAVFASADDVTYFRISGAVSTLAVGTTTYTDTGVPTSYSGDLAPTAGQFYPPPSCKFLAATDNRLFMAGAWESTAGTGLMTPKASRVWFTPVLGSSDLGDDERCVNSSGLSLKLWVDVGESDGDDITGLAGPIDGILYVFKQRAIWRLVPTGLDDKPYRAERITDKVGAVQQYAITVGEDGTGNTAIYFSAIKGPYRLTIGYGIEWLGSDIIAPYDPINPFDPLHDISCVWDPSTHVVWWFPHAAPSAWGAVGQAAFQPQFEQRTAGGVRGGWTQHAIKLGTSADGTKVAGGVVAQLSSFSYKVLYMYGTGDGGTTDAIGYLYDNALIDGANSTPFTVSVTSRRFMFGREGAHRFTVGQPIVEYERKHATSVPTVTYVADVTGQGVTASPSGTAVAVKIESLADGASDLWAVKFTVAWYAATNLAAAGRDAVYSLIVPYDVNEAT